MDELERLDELEDRLVLELSQSALDSSSGWVVVELVVVVSEGRRFSTKGPPQPQLMYQ